MKKKFTIILLFAILLICVGYYIKTKYIFKSISDFKNIFERKELSIEHTTLILEKVKPIAQLFTTTYYTEFPCIETKETDAYFGLTTEKKEIVLIAKGYCFAGTDLKKFTKDDFIFNDSFSCTVNLPNSEILDIVMNPTDFITFSEKGAWTEIEIKEVKNKARVKLKECALNDSILEKANVRSIKQLTAFLYSLGYKNVDIKIKK